MRRKILSYILLLSVVPLFLVATTFTPPHRRDLTVGPVDRDGDGDPDFLRIDPSYDGDPAGDLTSDVRAAVLALTDTDGPQRELWVHGDFSQTAAPTAEQLDADDGGVSLILAPGNMTIHVVDGEWTGLPFDPNNPVGGIKMLRFAETPVSNEPKIENAHLVGHGRAVLNGNAPEGYIGTATAGASTSLTDANANDDEGWTANRWTTGADAPPTGVVRVIVKDPKDIGSGREVCDLVSHTSTVYTVDCDRVTGGNQAWAANPVNGDGYYIAFDSTTAKAGTERAVQFSDCNTCSVTGMTIKGSAHAAIYADDGRDFKANRNLVLDAGTFFDTTPASSQPCLYFFISDPNDVFLDLQSNDNDLQRCGAAAINDRDDGNGFYDREVIGNHVDQEWPLADGNAQSCISGHAAENYTATWNTCIGGKIAYTGDGTSTFYDASSAVPVIGGGKNIRICDNRVIELHSNSTEGIIIGPNAYATDVTVCNNDVWGDPDTGSKSDGIQIFGPIRGGLRVADNDIRAMNGQCFKQLGSGFDDRSELTSQEYINNTCTGWSYKTNRLDGGQPNVQAATFLATDGLRFIGNSFFDHGGQTIRFNGAAVGAVIADTHIDGLRRQYRGKDTLANATSASKRAYDWWIITDGASTSDCSTGGGATQSCCIWDGSSFGRCLGANTNPAIRLDGGKNTNTLVTDTYVTNYFSNDEALRCDASDDSSLVIRNIIAADTIDVNQNAWQLNSAVSFNGGSPTVSDELCFGTTDTGASCAN